MRPIYQLGSLYTINKHITALPCSAPPDTISTSTPTTRAHRNTLIRDLCYTVAVCLSRCVKTITSSSQFWGVWDLIHSYLYIHLVLICIVCSKWRLCTCLDAELLKRHLIVQKFPRISYQVHLSKLQHTTKISSPKCTNVHKNDRSKSTRWHRKHLETPVGFQDVVNNLWW